MFDMWNQILTAMNNGQYTDSFNRSANAPIPGLTGPLGNGAGIPGVGMAPPQQPIPAPTMGNHMFQPIGPYGQQAVQLAGLLGNRGVPQQPVGGAQINSILGDKARMPFYRPTGK